MLGSPDCIPTISLLSLHNALTKMSKRVVLEVLRCIEQSLNGILHAFMIEFRKQRVTSGRQAACRGGW
jgi:hypothetical protein